MWGFTGILGVLIKLDAIILVWHRVLIAFVALGLYMALKKKSIKIESSSQLIQILLIGLVVALHWITFFQSIQLSTASLGILCLSTTTIHVSWLEPLVMKRRISPWEIAMGLLVIFGIYFVSADFDAGELKALAFGLSSAFFAALFSVFNAKFVRQTSPAVITFYEMIAAYVGITVLLLLTRGIGPELFVMSLSDLLWLLFLGILCTSFAFLATIEVVKHLGAFTVSLSINLEPVYTIILAVFILNEHKLLNNRFYIGAAIIVLVVLLNGILKSPYLKKRFARIKM